MGYKKIMSILISASLLATVVLQRPISVSANTDKEIVFDLKEKISEIAPLKTDNIIVNNEAVNLYVEFIDNELAINSFNEKYKEELEFLKESFDLEYLTIENWQEYYISLRGIEDSSISIPNNILENKHLMLGFFDIYENSFKNIEAIEYYNMISKKRTAITVKNLEKLSYSIPYTSKISTDEGEITSVEYEDTERIQLKEGDKKEERIATKTYGINLTNAINYASTYGPAGAYNSPTYKYFLTGDCTNFVSQVLVAGGVSQIYSSSPSSGWWFKRTNSSDPYNPYIYSHSLSWLQADTFARYWGVSYTTKSNASFSGKLYAGDIIGYDESSDGDWDHLGFITQADDYTANYGGKIYYDYKVAQHTSDYNAWASSSTNGWDNLENYGYTYALIRD